ncbi:hypothetical protein [Chryseobacterium gallinarum]|uniref:Cytochrome C551 n=1 Tax=Chryseobacterium gallinarum TaxID=1324352 RepID=A0ABX6KLX9_CHRGL|nr:hypothetical protein [Chryseobacterium gallinarum]QIY89656.1 hypothetical protein FOB44_02845 [Chryseobacterium gallinarum]
MKKLFLTTIAISFMIACKKNDTQKDMPATDSVDMQRSYSDTANSTTPAPKDSVGSRDSINTKTHIGGRRTSNNNTGNGTGNINAAVSDSARPAK